MVLPLLTLQIGRSKQKTLPMSLGLSYPNNVSKYRRQLFQRCTITNTEKRKANVNKPVFSDYAKVKIWGESSVFDLG